MDRQGTMKRKSESSDDQIFDKEKESSEPQEKRASPSPWLTAEKEEVPPVATKRKKFGQGKCFNSVHQKLSLACVSPVSITLWNFFVCNFLKEFTLHCSQKFYPICSYLFLPKFILRRSSTEDNGHGFFWIFLVVLISCF